MSKRPYRAWINQPSKLQPLHHLHGTKVIVTSIDSETAEVFFTEGCVISGIIPKSALSTGWPRQLIVPRGTSKGE